MTTNNKYSENIIGNMKPCPGCVGKGTIAAPQSGLDPMMIQIPGPRMTCPQCHGTAILAVSVPPSCVREGCGHSKPNHGDGCCFEAVGVSGQDRCGCTGYLGSTLSSGDYETLAWIARKQPTDEERARGVVSISIETFDRLHNLASDGVKARKELNDHRIAAQNERYKFGTDLPGMAAQRDAVKERLGEVINKHDGLKRQLHEAERKLAEAQQVEPPAASDLLLRIAQLETELARLRTRPALEEIRADLQRSDHWQGNILDTIYRLLRLAEPKSLDEQAREDIETVRRRIKRKRQFDRGHHGPTEWANDERLLRLCTLAEYTRHATDQRATLRDRAEKAEADRDEAMRKLERSRRRLSQVQDERDALQLKIDAVRKWVSEPLGQPTHLWAQGYDAARLEVDRLLKELTT